MHYPEYLKKPGQTPNEMYMARCRYLLKLAALQLPGHGGLGNLSLAVGYKTEASLYSAFARKVIPPTLPLAIEALVGKDFMPRSLFDRLPHEIED